MTAHEQFHFIAKRLFEMFTVKGNPTEVGCRFKSMLDFWTNKLGEHAATPLALFHPIFYTQQCGKSGSIFLAENGPPITEPQ